MYKALVSSFLLGVTLGAGPCMASCGPLLISYAAGTNKSVFKSLGAYFLFCFGRIIVYLALGVLVYNFGQAVTEHFVVSASKITAYCAGAFIALVGILVAIGRGFFGVTCLKWQKFFLEKDPKTIFLMGLLIGLIPCLPYVSLLSYIGLVSKSWHDAAVYSFAFGIGTAVSPLLAIVGFAGFLPGLLKDEKFRRLFNALCGLVLVVLGVQLIMRGF